MIGVADFAKEVGRDKALISRLVKRGVIPRNKDGSIPYEEGMKAFEAYDKGPKNKGGRGKKNPPIVKPEPPVNDAPELPQDPPEVNNRPGSQSSINAAMNKAKLADTTFKARIRELEYKLKSGELLPKDEVAAEAQWLAEQVKSKLLAIPPRISSMCEGRTSREIEEIITDAINGALKELQKCKYEPPQEE